jgi:hypothetical protein
MAQLSNVVGIASGLLIAGTTLAEAASDHSKFALDARGLALIPISSDLYSTAGGFGLGLYYRPSRRLQLDLGVDLGLDALKVSARYVDENGQTGTLSDREAIAYLGARYLFPNRADSLIGSIGVGLAGGQYGESGPGQCDTCGTRNGLGGYGVVGIERYFGRTKKIGLGVEARYARLSMTATQIGTFSVASSTDGWLSFVGRFILRF